MALVTGAVWGQPTWGTWWEWDPRLTSFLILLLFYLGYMALWSAIENPDNAADLTGVAVFLASDGADYIVAQTYNVDGGNWLS